MNFYNPEQEFTAYSSYLYHLNKGIVDSISTQEKEWFSGRSSHRTTNRGRKCGEGVREIRSQRTRHPIVVLGVIY